ncbi:MAG: 2-C-methyl-D-erythritol 2,4-cyclodiphosphate synthase [Candidatus Omnitrophota bacterium]|nr:2-C-methyl-D-erythritol 2,4-cyclodiphosphate synthase [Candidatus Omnitrophota bacterium]
MRVGIGYDIHRLVEGKPLMLGGVEIPHIKGLEGHSDGDALLHAICDAILGAAGLDDIGYQFPVNDNRYLNISSLELLKEVSEKINKKGFKVEYVDSVIILEEPKIAPFKDNMKREIAAALGIGVDVISVKATTQEGVGAIGRGEALAAYAVACLV